MPQQLSFAKAGLLSPKTLRNEIVQGVDQMRDLNGGDGYVSANSLFPVVDLEAPTEAYFTIGGAMGPMSHVSRTGESPIGTLGDINEKDITTEFYSKKLAPEKEVDEKLNSERQILSLYEWAAGQLRGETFLTREQVAWQGNDVTDGLIGQDGDTPHPDLPNSNVLDDNDSWDDTENAKPYQDLEYASYLIDDTYQGFLEADAPSDVQVTMTPSLFRDMKFNEDMQSRFQGVDVWGLTDDQVRNLLADEVPTINKCRVKLPRMDEDGNYLDEEGDVVDDIEDAHMDNVLEPYDPSIDDTRRCAVVGTPGPSSAFIPAYDGNEGPFDDANAPSQDDEVDFDNDSMFGTQTWMGHDPRVTWLKSFQDIGFHLHLPEHWILLMDI